MSDPDDGARPSEAGARWLGQTLDERYRILAVLGEGGMGTVFRAEHVRLAKSVAVKIILPELAGNAELARRFAREAMVTAKLDHPHVVSALDTGVLPDGGAYLVMSLAPGAPLRASIAQRASWRFACHIGAQIADALAAAHAIGVVHRDLKPENVMVEERDGGVLHARVLDFGIARAIDASAEGATAATALTRIGTILGTPGYMPPEQALGDVVDARADLYALGVVVWEMSTGRRLFAQSELREITMAQLTEPVPEIGGDAPAELQALLDALLMPKAADRPASASEVQSTLRRLRGSAEPAVMGVPSGVSIAPTTPIPPTLSSGYAAAADSVARPVGSAGRPSRALLVGAAMALVVGMGALALVGMRMCGGGAAGDGSLLDEPELADVPEELRADASTLIAGVDVGARARAAARLRTDRARLPAFIGHLADFELGADCDERRAAVRALRADGDVRSIAPLERIQALPNRGCGTDGTADCHQCMRRDVDHALETLRGASGAGDEPTPSAPPPAAPTKRPPHGRGRGHWPPH